MQFVFWPAISLTNCYTYIGCACGLVDRLLIEVSLLLPLRYRLKYLPSKAKVKLLRSFVLVKNRALIFLFMNVYDFVWWEVGNDEVYGEIRIFYKHTCLHFFLKNRKILYLYCLQLSPKLTVKDAINVIVLSSKTESMLTIIVPERLTWKSETSVYSFLNYFAN